VAMPVKDTAEPCIYLGYADVNNCQDALLHISRLVVSTPSDHTSCCTLTMSV